MQNQTTFIMMALFLMCCNTSEMRYHKDFVVFENDTRNVYMGFKPSCEQIEKADMKFLEYLESRTKNNSTVLINSIDGMVPLQEQLKYYKRRYFGLINNGGERVIKVEFVFARCGGNDEWKKLEYTNIGTKECWWSVLYNIGQDRITDLNFNE